MTHAPTNLQDQIVLAGVAVWIIEKLKASKRFPFIDQYTDQLNKWLSVALAIAGTVGISVTFNMADGSLLITGLTPESVLSFAWNATSQFVIQQAGYHGVLKRSTHYTEDN
jgi:UDP-N-acetylmuramyl pentapeptide phosphotransferase/UDP-N-acetylglucosamine-1-phosphate transferase